jgi:hypothetical protein
MKKILAITAFSLVFTGASVSAMDMMRKDHMMATSGGAMMMKDKMMASGTKDMMKKKMDKKMDKMNMTAEDKAMVYEKISNISKRSDITDLQKMLVEKGYLKMKVNGTYGNYGPLTRAAHKKYRDGKMMMKDKMMDRMMASSTGTSTASSTR